MPSASQISRAFLCPASAVIEKVYRPSGPAAERGARIHHEIQAAVPEMLRSLLGDSIETELALSYDVETDTAREIGHHVERNYGELRPTEAPMSLDLVGSLGLVEIKTGRMRCPPPIDNHQIRAQVLGLSRARKLPTVRAHLATLVGSEFEIDSHTFTTWDIDGIADDLSGLYVRISGVKAQLDRGEAPDVSPSSEACRYCDCAPNCPSPWSKS